MKKKARVKSLEMEYKNSIEEGRSFLRAKMDAILENAGFDRQYVNSRSFYELEEELHIGHYNIFGTSDRRKGHIPLSFSSRRRIEENIKYIFKH